MNADMKNALREFAVSLHSKAFCTSWYFDADDSTLVSLSLSLPPPLRDLSMNNISKIQSRAFHRLHLLSELWVGSFSATVQLIGLHRNGSHMTRNSYSPSCWCFLWWGLMTLACDWSLPPRNSLQQQQRGGSWDGCTRKGLESRRGGNMIVTPRANIWFLKVLREQVMCSDSKLLLSLTQFQRDGSAGAAHM